jgi:hypothetical protein
MQLKCIVCCFFAAESALCSFGIAKGLAKASHSLASIACFYSSAPLIKAISDYDVKLVQRLLYNSASGIVNMWLYISVRLFEIIYRGYCCCILFIAS